MKDIFPTLAGNEKLKNVLSGNLSHAYIIEGDRGSGRLTAARLAAATVLCENKDTADHTIPCLECPVCSRIMRGIHPDVIEVSTGTKKRIGVDAIRDIRSQVFVTPSESECKFFIIRDADLMTPEAQNALLISLEEPPEFSLFFLLATDKSLLLETIRSHCITLSTEKLSDDTVANILSDTPEGSRLKNADNAAFLSVIKSANGSVGEAIRLVSERSGESDGDRFLADRLIRVIFSGNTAEKVSLSSVFPKTRDQLDSIFSFSVLIIRDIIAKKMHTGATPLFFTDLSEAPFTEVPLRRLISVARSLEDARLSLKGNISPSLTAERIIMQKI